MDKALLDIIDHFETLGEDFAVGKRNKIKIIPYKNIILNIKSFQVPGLIKGIIYRFFRKSKAKRSYTYAKILKDKDIGTPDPIGFYENKSWLRLYDSYYICEHLTPDYVFKDLFNVYIEDLENILKQFALFSFKLHENGIEFLDHSPGNTLIKKVGEHQYEFYLVDLNRMKFHKNMDLNTRMKNMCRTTPSEAMVKTISYEYAKLYGKKEEEIFTVMWHYNLEFHKRKLFKKNLKAKIGL